MTAVAYQWTIERYHQAIDAGVFADQNLELLQGELVLMPPEGMPHVYFSDRTADILRRNLAGRAQIREGRPITLPNNSEPMPDVAIIQPLDAVYLEHHPYPENIFWLMEYSHSTLKQDLTRKKLIYGSADILEYWVVNLQDQQLTVFRDPSPTGYQSEASFSDGMVSPLAFPDLSIDVRRFFQV
jgi:Uma2 family endonuclease